MTMDITNEGILTRVRELIEGWCDRRCLIALRLVLHGYPLHNELTDGWADLLDALQNVRAFARDELTENEKTVIGKIIAEVSKAVYW